MHPIKVIIRGEAEHNQKGVCSICSASNFVIEAMLRRAKETGRLALIEATANQVNQFGGYTGMRAADFAKKVFDMADMLELDREQIVLGGDHLGPYPWRDEEEESAMEKAADLITEYVQAGFSKIHIDTSMRLGSDDVNQNLSDETIAQRAASLAKTAMVAKQKGCEYVFVLGSEVPVPGGVKGEKVVRVTSPQAFRQAYDCFSKAFLQNGLDEIWQDVIALVVQPGVEFGEMSVTRYDRGKAKELCVLLRDYPNVAFEGHSTDYQPKDKLKEMVEDGVKILKVGPALTFHQREAIFALEMIEKELLGEDGKSLSNFSQILEEEMLKDPSHWKDYYHGDEQQLKLMRSFSLSDRCRYYFAQKEIIDAISKLIGNLDKIKIPFSVLSQYMPIQAKLVNSGIIKPDAKSLIVSRISNCIDEYLEATEE